MNTSRRAEKQAKAKELAEGHASARSRSRSPRADEQQPASARRSPRVDASGDAERRSSPRAAAQPGSARRSPRAPPAQPALDTDRSTARDTDAERDARRQRRRARKQEAAKAAGEAAHSPNFKGKLSPRADSDRALSYDGEYDHAAVTAAAAAAAAAEAATEASAAEARAVLKATHAARVAAKHAEGLLSARSGQDEEAGAEADASPRARRRRRQRSPRAGDGDASDDAAPSPRRRRRRDADGASPRRSPRVPALPLSSGGGRHGSGGASSPTLADMQSQLAALTTNIGEMKTRQEEKLRATLPKRPRPRPAAAASKKPAPAAFAAAAAAAPLSAAALQLVCAGLTAACRKDVHLKGSWFRLFRKLDTDGSDNLDREELVAAVRDELRVTKQAMSTAKLFGLWAALDGDGSGRVNAGEFANFLRAHAAADGTAPVVGFATKTTARSAAGTSAAAARATASPRKSESSPTTPRKRRPAAAAASSDDDGDDAGSSDDDDDASSSDGGASSDAAASEDGTLASSAKGERERRFSDVYEAEKRQYAASLQAVHRTRRAADASAVTAVHGSAVIRSPFSYLVPKHVERAGHGHRAAHDAVPTRKRGGGGSGSESERESHASPLPRKTYNASPLHDVAEIERRAGGNVDAALATQGSPTGASIGDQMRAAEEELYRTRLKAMERAQTIAGAKKREAATAAEAAAGAAQAEADRNSAAKALEWQKQAQKRQRAAREAEALAASNARLTQQAERAARREALAGGLHSSERRRRDAKTRKECTARLAAQKAHAAALEDAREDAVAARVAHFKKTERERSMLYHPSLVSLPSRRGGGDDASAAASSLAPIDDAADDAAPSAVAAKVMALADRHARADGALAVDEVRAFLAPAEFADFFEWATEHLLERAGVDVSVHALGHAVKDWLLSVGGLHEHAAEDWLLSVGVPVAAPVAAAAVGDGDGGGGGDGDNDEDEDEDDEELTPEEMKALNLKPTTLLRAKKQKLTPRKSKPAPPAVPEPAAASSRAASQLPSQSQSTVNIGTSMSASRLSAMSQPSLGAAAAGRRRKKKGPVWKQPPIEIDAYVPVPNLLRPPHDDPVKPQSRSRKRPQACYRKKVVPQAPNSPRSPRAGLPPLAAGAAAAPGGDVRGGRHSPRPPPSGNPSQRRGGRKGAGAGAPGGRNVGAEARGRAAAVLLEEQKQLAAALEHLHNDRSLLSGYSRGAGV